jgi:hypothetical protein
MKLIQKSKTQQNIESIESAANTAILAAASAAHALNNSYNTFWNLPDDELEELLQYLLNEGELFNIFKKHGESATALNKILEDGGYEGVRAIDKITREFTIDEFGTLKLVVPIEPEILPENLEQQE